MSSYCAFCGTTHDNTVCPKCGGIFPTATTIISPPIYTSAPPPEPQAGRARPREGDSPWRFIKSSLTGNARIVDASGLTMLMPQFGSDAVLERIVAAVNADEKNRHLLSLASGHRDELESQIAALQSRLREVEQERDAAEAVNQRQSAENSRLLAKLDEARYVARQFSEVVLGPGGDSQRAATRDRCRLMISLWPSPASALPGATE